MKLTYTYAKDATLINFIESYKGSGDYIVLTSTFKLYISDTVESLTKRLRLNNLEDLSFNWSQATITAYTYKELETLATPQLEIASNDQTEFIITVSNNNQVSVTCQGLTIEANSSQDYVYSWNTMTQITKTFTFEKEGYISSSNSITVTKPVLLKLNEPVFSITKNTYSSYTVKISNTNDVDVNATIGTSLLKINANSTYSLSEDWTDTTKTIEVIFNATGYNSSSNSITLSRPSQYNELTVRLHYGTQVDYKYYEILYGTLIEPSTYAKTITGYELNRTSPSYNFYMYGNATLDIYYEAIKPNSPTISNLEATFEASSTSTTGYLLNLSFKATNNNDTAGVIFNTINVDGHGQLSDSFNFGISANSSINKVYSFDIEQPEAGDLLIITSYITVNNEDSDKVTNNVTINERG